MAPVSTCRRSNGGPCSLAKRLSQTEAAVLRRLPRLTIRLPNNQKQKAAGIFALRLAGFPKFSVYRMHPNPVTEVKRTLRTT
jgi:hypothetical protein